MTRYGYENKSSNYPLASQVYGHRLIVGQHWLEYMLEFLNVLAGFEYDLGQGVTVGLNGEAPATKIEYLKATRMGLRRFVFYDKWEKTDHPWDDRARELMLERLRETYLTQGEDKTLEEIASLLRSLACLEEHRSWYAKSLFPVNHTLLFHEALRKGATKSKKALQDGLVPQDLDKDMSFSAHNFFARGGEVYYLILSAGTRHDQVFRERVAKGVEDLLKGSNQELGRVAEIIDKSWTDLLDEPSEVTGTLGWIPTPDCGYYRTVAEDFDSYVQTKLPPLEKLDVMSYLIAFHMTLYIYHRSHPSANTVGHEGDSCLAVCRPALLVDILEGGDGVLRGASALNFREQEAFIKDTANAFIGSTLIGWLRDKPMDKPIAVVIEEKVDASFGLTKSQRATLHGTLVPAMRRVDAGELTDIAYVEEAAEALRTLLMPSFKSAFLPVHRKLAKSCGFVSPKKGPGARYTFSDNLLKALTLTCGQPDMTYAAFLTTLYERYGIVIAMREAKESGVYKRNAINADYYDRNSAALLERMLNAGLARQYSDATAMLTVKKP